MKRARLKEYDLFRVRQALLLLVETAEQVETTEGEADALLNAARATRDVWVSLRERFGREIRVVRNGGTNVFQICASSSRSGYWMDTRELARERVEARRAWMGRITTRPVSNMNGERTESVGVRTVICRNGRFRVQKDAANQ